MGEDVTKGKEVKKITIDPKELHEGTCQIRRLGDKRISICKDDGKIKIFEVEKEE